MRTWAICYYTFRESLARKTFVAFFVISSIILGFLLFAVNIDAVDGAMASLSFVGSGEETVDVDVNLFISRVQAGIAIFLYTVGLFFSVFATASLVPNMLAKGNIDWLLAKPVSRPQLLIGRFLGALLIVGFNVFYLVLGSWLILSLKTGVWQFAFIKAGFLIVAVFAVLYAFMSFIGVTLQNAAISVMSVFLFVILGVEALQSDIVYALLPGKVSQTILEIIYYLTPRTFEVGKIVWNEVLIEPVEGWRPLLHSMGIGVLYFSLSILVFARKNF